MARNDGIDRTVARNANLTRDDIENVQHHNEREKDSYGNVDIVLERIPLNVHFKVPNGNYEDVFAEMESSGTISTRGLKQDAKVYGELVFDVNSAYFYNNGGYEFAKKYYEEAYKAAIEIVGGEQYIISAVMHADERNKAMSEALGEDVYHYHMHVVYVPVVEKKVLWSKRCKDPNLVGTVKETIMQVSSCKKWDSKYALDENGEPILQKNGKPVLKKSYSVLQDDYYNHMRNAGYKDLERGERGSTEEHLTVTQFKVEKEQERLKELEEKIEKLAPILEDVEKVERQFSYPPDEFLPEPGTLESAKSYREKKAIPVFEKMVEAFRSLGRKYGELKNRYYKLENDFSYERDRCNRLVYRNEILVEENEKMKDSLKDFQRVKSYFGPEKIIEAIRIQKQKEAEKRTQKRKILSRGR